MLCEFCSVSFTCKLQTAVWLTPKRGRTAIIEMLSIPLLLAPIPARCPCWVVTCQRWMPPRKVLVAAAG